MITDFIHHCNDYLINDYDYYDYFLSVVVNYTND